MRDQSNFIEVDFHGFGPSNPYTWSTSLFINVKRRNELKYSKKLCSKSGVVPAQVTA